MTEPRTEPCGQTAGVLPHPPHKFMRNRAVHQCPGDTTPAMPGAEAGRLRDQLDDARKDADAVAHKLAVALRRLRLAHQARRAKGHQLDGIRRALCDIGFMEDDDPYSHADLEDVIRQAAPAEAAIARVTAVRDQWQGRLLPSPAYELLTELRAALDEPGHDGGPSLAEADDDGRRWFDCEKDGK